MPTLPTWCYTVVTYYLLNAYKWLILNLAPSVSCSLLEALNNSCLDRVTFPAVIKDIIYESTDHCIIDDKNTEEEMGRQVKPNNDTSVSYFFM